MDPKNEELVLVELHVVSHLNTHTPDTIDFTTIIVGAAMATVIVLLVVVFVVVIAFKKYQSKIRDSM